MAIANPKSSTSKRKTAKKKGGKAIPAESLSVTPQDVEVAIMADADPQLTAFDPAAASAAVVVPLDDGEVEIDLNPQPAPSKESKNFDDNLAEHLSEGALGDIASRLLDAIDEDERDRQEWLTERAEGIELLGLKIERPGGSISSSSAPIEGQSRVRDPVLLEAVLRGQANAYAELCPAEGPCKVVNYGAETPETDKLSEDFEKDFNFYLTGSAPGTATEYYPDTRKMLGMTVYASGMFKKVYSCPLRRRPVSESVDGGDLIIPSNATDLRNAGRITHQIDMRQSTMRRMQILGVYRDIPLTKPSPEPDALEQKKADLAGMQITNLREEDLTYTVYESYCELDIPGFEHKEDGKITGLPLPYRVTLDKDSRAVLEIRRNWQEDDADFQAKIPFVGFPFVTGFGGVYGIGLLQILGNPTVALTAMLREAIDAGMFANFPGGLIAKQNTRQLNNEIRVAPGALAPVDIGSMPSIDKAVMPLPYKDVTPGLIKVMEMLTERAGRLGGTAEAPVGEGRQDAPVGTTLALIEQATKIEGAVHKAFHAAQAEELRLLKELFKEDPEALWRGNRRPAMGPDKTSRLQRFQQALNDCEIVPASDPNVPSHIHRLAKAQTLLQMAPAFPDVINKREAVINAMTMMKMATDGGLILPPQAAQMPPPDPIKMAELQLKARDLQIKEASAAAKAQNDAANRKMKENIESMKLAEKAAGGAVQPKPHDPLQARALDLKAQQIDQVGAKITLDAHNAQADRKSREAIEAMKIAQTVGVHPESDGLVDEQLIQMRDFLSPATQNKPAPGMGDGGPVNGNGTPAPRGMSQEDVDRIVQGLELAWLVRDYGQNLH